MISRIPRTLALKFRIHSSKLQIPRVFRGAGQLSLSVSVTENMLTGLDEVEYALKQDMHTIITQLN